MASDDLLLFHPLLVHGYGRNRLPRGEFLKDPTPSHEVQRAARESNPRAALFILFGLLVTQHVQPRPSLRRHRAVATRAAR